MDVVKKIAVVALIMIGFCVLLMFYLPTMYNSSRGFHVDVQVTKLSEKPDTYGNLPFIPICVSEAISSHQDHVVIDSNEEAQLNQLLAAQNTNNFLINGTYYQIGVVFVDAYPTSITAALFLAIMLIVGVAFMAMMIAWAFKKREEPKEKKNECFEADFNQ